MKKLFAAAFIMLISFSTLFAQNKVTGKVTSSEDGSPGGAAYNHNLKAGDTQEKG
ncbi:MAG: hypothetical protein IJ636_04740 [Bacteroidales bacterium]|nr:hypothetical protein [Bacteroidales bacterium]